MRSAPKAAVSVRRVRRWVARHAGGADFSSSEPTGDGSRPDRIRAWHALDPASVPKHLGSNIDHGLSLQAVTQRSAEHVPNCLAVVKPPSALWRLAMQFHNLLIYG